jgi:hypothetical protein
MEENMIKIENGRNCKDGEWVDRRSVLGNPFIMKGEKERDIVCEKYKEWFYKQLKGKNPEFLHELRRLYKLWKVKGELTLICWCAPKRCHSETIKDFLYKMTEKK